MHIDKKSMYRKNAPRIITSSLLDSGFSKSQAYQVTNLIIGCTQVYIQCLIGERKNQASRSGLQDLSSRIIRIAQSKMPQDMSLSKEKHSLLTSAIRFHSARALDMEGMLVEEPDSTPRGIITADVLMEEIHPGATIELRMKDDDEFGLFRDIRLSSIENSSHITTGTFTWVGSGKGRKDTFAVLQAEDGPYLLLERTLLNDMLIEHLGVSPQSLPPQVYLEPSAITMNASVDIDLKNYPLQIYEALGDNFFITRNDGKFCYNKNGRHPVEVYRNILTNELITLPTSSIGEQEKKKVA